MAETKGTVIMFPRWKETLEDKSIQLINDKKFKEALETIDELLAYNGTTFNTNMAKLLCHVELNEYDQAAEFAQSLLDRDDPDFAAYLEFYLTISYQMNDFELVIELYELEKEAGMIPNELKERLEEIYKLSFQMNQQEKRRDALAYLKELELMINDGDERGQWELINRLRKTETKPPEQIKQLLTSEKVHPVTKTTIFNWLKESEVSEKIEIEKFGETVKVKPEEVMKISKHPTLQKTLYYLVEIEQENPSLYELIEDLLVRYTYVKYPMFYEEDDANMVAEALIYIGKKNLHLPIDADNISNKVHKYIDEINKCNEIYLNIIDH